MGYPKRLRDHQASAIVESELVASNCRHDSSSAPAHDKLLVAGRQESWWLANISPTEDATTSRSLALLRAYVRIAKCDDENFSGLPLFADGLRLDAKKSIRMDRSVMGRFLRDGLVRFLHDGTKDAQFELTDEVKLLME